MPKIKGDPRRFPLLRALFLCLLGFSLLLLICCAGKGLLISSSPESILPTPIKMTPNALHTKNPVFIVCGDMQIGWRATEKFLNHRNWLTWKMLIFPFYQLYWLGNGLVGGINALRRTPDYGWEQFLNVRDSLYREVQQSEIDFILVAGDLVEDGRRPKQWEAFLTAYGRDVPLLSQVPLITVRGNHDRTLDFLYGLPNFKAVMDTPPFFILTYPDITLFMLDSLHLLDDYQTIPDDIQNLWFREWFVSEESDLNPSWLERSLSACRTKFKIVVMHHPPISFGKHHYDWNNPHYGVNLSDKRLRFIKLLQKHRVQLLFCGHEHFYEHNLLLPESGTTGEALHIIVAGSAGAPVRDALAEREIRRALLDFHRQNLHVQRIRFEKIYNYIRVKAFKLKLEIQVLEVPTDNHSEARLIETITLE